MDVSVIYWFFTTALAVVLLYLLSTAVRFWSHRHLVGEAATALLLVGALFLCASQLTLASKIILVFMQLWLVVLSIRLLFGRLDALFLQTSTRQNTQVAFGLLAVIVISLLLLEPFGAHVAYNILLFKALVASIIVGAIFVFQAIWTLKHYKLRVLHQHFSAKELPTVTLAIPARNETHALSECLEAAIGSDYPKLEIIVLDDCSQDNTSQLIRAFAQNGVRFIQGSEPASGWLGKNQAMQTLAEQASGEYIVFTDVDTHLSPQSITKMVQYALSHDSHMMSVLPQRRDRLQVATLFWQLRYYWQIVLPITRRRVPVANQCWLIRADALRQLGGIAGVKNKIVPEGFFARKLAQLFKYRFIIANNELGITTAKRWSSQNETAIRFLYPTFKRQPLYVLIGCLALALLALLPFATLVALSLQASFTLYWALALLASLLLLASYGMVVVRTLPHSWLLSIIAFPLSLLQEFVLLILSMLLYEFGEVNWKGRNVCYPVIKRKLK
jgi:chlorobactene glucosyltransferase